VGEKHTSPIVKNGLEGVDENVSGKRDPPGEKTYWRTKKIKAPLSTTRRVNRELRLCSLLRASMRARRGEPIGAEGAEKKAEKGTGERDSKIELQEVRSQRSGGRPERQAYRRNPTEKGEVVPGNIGIELMERQQDLEKGGKVRTES